jgi:monoterpene epsilon-lactone hydrolase
LSASPEMQQVIEYLRSLEGSLGRNVPLENQREAYDAVSSLYPLDPEVHVEQADIEGGSGEWISWGEVDEERSVVYFHGGGYVIGSPTSHRELAARISKATGARVLVVDYPLAPEHKFPAALEGARQAFRWVLARGFSPSKVALAGDSAGGGLAVATILALAGVHDMLPGALVCLSPWVDLTQSGGSIAQRASIDPLVTKEMLDYDAELYLPEGTDPKDPLASPIFGDLSVLPPTLVQVGTLEVLYDDATRLVEKAKAAGVDARLSQYEGAFHVFQQMAARTPEATAALEEIGTFLREHLA